MFRSRITVLAAVAASVTAAPALSQSSIYLGSEEFEFLRNYTHGPLALDDSTAAMVRDGRLYLARVDADAPADGQLSATALDFVSLEFGYPFNAVAAAPDGTVYALAGFGGCDVPSEAYVVSRLTRGGGGDWELAVVSSVHAVEFGGLLSVDGFGVSADTTFWTSDGGELRRWRPGDREFETAAFRGGTEESYALTVVDGQRAFLTSAYAGFYLDWAGTEVTVTPLPAPDRSGFVGLGRRDSTYVYVTDERTSRLDGAGEIVAERPTPAALKRTRKLVTDGGMVYAYSYDGLQVWDTRADSVSARVTYYPDLAWGIRGLYVDASGGAVLMGASPEADATLPEATSATHVFLQYVPAGADPDLSAPPVELEPELRPVRRAGSEDVTARYALRLRNTSDVRIDSARAVGSRRFGAICAEFWNGADFADVPAGGLADGEEEYGGVYYFLGGSPTARVRYVEDYFSVAHVNGCPSGVGRLVQEAVVSLAEVVDDPSLRAYPTLADARVSVEWVGTRTSLAVYDVLGRVALRQNLRPGQTSAELDVSGLPVGAYRLAVGGEGGTAVRTFRVAR